MGIDSHLSTCVGTQSPKYLEMAQRHISLSGTPSSSKFSSEKSFARTPFALFDCFDSGVLKTTRAHVSGKADRAEGLLRLWDTDTSLITFREK
jgi:hypothetical protein